MSLNSSSVGGHSNSNQTLPILKAEKISKIFSKGKKEIHVVKNIDFSIYPGETIAITGASGVGKSTFLHILGTLEPPTSGRVLYGPEQQDLSKLSEKSLSLFRNRTLGFIFQFHYLLPEFSAKENVMMPALIAGHSKSLAAKQAESLLEFVGLKDRLDHRPNELSGGEQQRVAIARAVILRPKILMADELTGNLDTVNRGMVMDLLVRLSQATGISILLITHDAEIAKKMNRILVMRDGAFIS